MPRSPSRFQGQLAVPTEPVTDWDLLATSYRRVKAETSILDLLRQRAGLQPADATAGLRTTVEADRHRLIVELRHHFR